MQYLILTLLFLNFLLITFLLIKINKKQINETNVAERLGKMESATIKELSEFKINLSKTINEEITKLTEKIEEKLYLINNRVNERLDENFEKSNQTFMNVLERLAKIDEAQKKLGSLSEDIVSLQSVLTDKKTRGIYGEVNLYYIMSSVFGENNKHIYQMQYKFPNGTIADCVLFTPPPLGKIAIDSKFPLENYQDMVDKNKSMAIREKAYKMFKLDMKKHIDAISEKYIINGVTTNQAILFLPAEAIFAELNAYHQDLVNYAYKKRVWITSPTTLISTLTTIELIIKNIERDKHAKVIQDELSLLDEEFKRYKMRWDKLYHSIETVSKDVKEIYTTTDKITKRFNSINQVEIEKLKE